MPPALSRAANHAVADLPPADAWEFIGALTRKMQSARAGLSVSSVANAAATLAGRSPSGAITLLDQPDSQHALHALVPAIASGLNFGFNEATEHGLAQASPDTLMRLACASEELARSIAQSPILIERLAQVIPEFEPSSFEGMKAAVLPFLTEDFQFAAARPLLVSLAGDSLMAEVKHLAEVNGFEAISFIAPVVGRAREINELARLRNILLTIRPSPRRDRFIRTTLAATTEDVTWLLSENHLETAAARQILFDVLRSATTHEFRTLLADATLAQSILSNVPIDTSDILLRAVNDAELPLPRHVETVERLLAISSDQQKIDLAKKALDRCLRDHFGVDEIGTLTMLLGVIGSMLDGASILWRGLERGVSSSIAERNLIAFNEAPPQARQRIMAAVDDFGRALEGRHGLAFDKAASDSCAQLLWDSQSINKDGLLRASGRLLPMLLRERRAPVSAMIAASFPCIYRELAREDDVPDLLKFVPFIDWDRCKSARRELVDAFLSSPAWTPSDLALTACRSSDSARIFRRTAKSVGGDAYIDRILAELTSLPQWCQEQTMITITQIRSDRGSKYNWRD